jgi:hypothetical protein
VDAARFDDLTIALTAPRRTILGGLAAGALTLLGRDARAGTEPTCAAPGEKCKKSDDCCVVSSKCKKKKGKKKGKCAKCPAERSLLCNVAGGPPADCCEPDWLCCEVGDATACCPPEESCCPDGAGEGCCPTGFTCCEAPGCCLDACDLTATLNGQNEVDGSGNPNQGDLDGSGEACVVLNAGQVCWSIAVAGIAPVTLDHIHRGAAGTNGPVVVDFGGQLFGCVAAAQALIDEIAGNPAGFYVNVHSSEFPGGAIRGQLG